LAALMVGVRAEDIGYLPPRMSPGFASSSISLREAPDALGTGQAAPVPWINPRSDGSRRWCALRSEIKEEAAGRGTFAEQSMPSA